MSVAYGNRWITYKWTKQVASDHGGTKVGMAIHWSKGIKARGELRTQFSHVIDIAPTILEAANLPEPKVVNDLALRNPQKLAELQALFIKEAERNHVLPIDDRTIERVNAALAGRPDLMADRTSLTLADGMTGMTENVFLNIKNKSKTIVAEIEVPESGAHGAIIVQGDRTHPADDFLRGRDRRCRHRPRHPGGRDDWFGSEVAIQRANHKGDRPG